MDEERQSAAEEFSSGVANLMMETEELRRSVLSSGDATTIHQLIDWKHALETTLSALDFLGRLTQDAVGAHVETDLYHHCRQRAVGVAQQTLAASFNFREPTEIDEDENDNDFESMPPPGIVRRDGQGAIARITELNLLLYHSFADEVSTGSVEEQLQTADEIVDSYVSYQKRVLRLRSRPAIANLVDARREGAIVTPTAVCLSADQEVPGMKVHVNEDDEDHGGGHSSDSKWRIAIKHFHAPVFTVVLGEASTLIDPLMQWHFSLPPQALSEPPIVTSVRKLCTETIKVLDEQAQQLVKRVSDWYWEDRPIESWMKKSAEMSTGEPSVEDYHQTQDQQKGELSILDGLVDEMAFSCQLLARYDHLMHPVSGELIPHSPIAAEILPEWNWKYAALERFLAVKQWQCALQVAAPVQIILGTEVQVPSVVEDAQYLSTRALERAASTRSLQAIGTVAHAISHDVWSMEMSAGVHQAILDQKGCWLEPRELLEKNEKSKQGDGGFASALLDALDSDMAKGGVPKSPPKNGGPNSGGFLSSIVSTFDDSTHSMQMKTHFCMLNGLNAASVSCNSLVGFLDSLVNDDEDSLLPTNDNDKSLSMVKLAREDLHSYGAGYKSTLQRKALEVLQTWCGTGSVDEACPPNFRGKAFNHLRYLLAKENLGLDSSSFNKTESDARLEKDLLGPLKESSFLSNLANKCDEGVLTIMGEQIACVLGDMFRQAIWQSETQVSDWGSLLLSKQLRMIQDFIAKITTSIGEGSLPPNLYQTWEPISQVVAVLQLEKPSHWLDYHETSVLSTDDLRRTFERRQGFSAEAIDGVMSQITMSGT